MSPPPGERIAALEAQLKTLADTVAQLDGTVAALQGAMAQANGGLKVLMWIGSFIGLTGIASLLHFTGVLPTNHPPTH